MHSRRPRSLALPLLLVLWVAMALPACVTTPAGYKAGLDLAARGDHAGAVAAFGKSVAADSRYAPAYLARAASFMALGQEQQALDDYTRAAELEPGNKAAWLGLASAEQRLGLYSPAASHYAQAANLDPADLDARLSLALCLNKSGRHGDAAKAYGQAAELASGDPGVFPWILGAQAASLALDDQCQAAAPLFDKVLALTPDDSQARLGRGLCLAENDRHEEALQDFSSLIQADPANGEALFARARSLAALGRAKEAVADFVAVADLDKAKAETLRNEYLNPKALLKVLTRAASPGKADPAKLLPVMECFAGQMLDKDMPGCRPLLDGLR